MALHNTESSAAIEHCNRKRIASPNPVFLKIKKAAVTSL
jgi:hypothetical protein